MTERDSQSVAIIEIALVGRKKRCEMTIKSDDREEKQQQ